MLNNHNSKVMLIQTTIDQSYNKVIATIKSCETKSQLEGASRMVKNFKKLYKQVGYPKVLLYNINNILNKQYIIVRCQL
mgnify:CR=1 FL=1